MEILGSTSNKRFVLVYELVGTAILLFVLNFSAGSSQDYNINNI